MAGLEGKEAPKKRRWGASCVLCRQRKQKCPGRDSDGNSLCQYCPSLGVECAYNVPGFVTRIDQAAKSADTLRGFVQSLAQADAAERDRLLEEWSSQQEVKPDKPPPRKRKKKNSPEEQAGEENGHDHPSPDSVRPVRTRTKSTPNIHADFAPPPAAEDVAATADEDEFKAAISRWENTPEYAARDSMLFEVEAQLLIESYFCWQNPRFCFLEDKDKFLRARQEKDKEICSEFLLWSLYCYASRVVPELEPRCDEFAAVAHAYLALELTKPSHITTAQGLLLLAAHHGVRGRHSQAWQQKGFASCIISDLEQTAEQKGDVATLKKLRRLWWSAHGWDTIQSLSMNRPPLMRVDTDHDPIKDLAEDLADDGTELWQPVITPGDTAVLPSQPQPNYQRKVFGLSAQLYPMIDNILERLYSGNHDLASGMTQAFVFATRDKLIDWQGRVAPEVLLDVDHLPHLPPSPHLLQFNLLIRMVWILLYRNFDGSIASSVIIEGAKKACSTSAREIYALFAAYEHAFPLKRLTYLAIFSAFSSAVVEAQQLKVESSETPAVLVRLAVLLRVLETGRHNVPGMARAIDIVHQQIARAAARSQTSLLPVLIDSPSSQLGSPTGHVTLPLPTPAIVDGAELQPFWTDFLQQQSSIAALCPGLSLTGAAQLAQQTSGSTTTPAWQPINIPAINGESDWFSRLATGTTW